MRGVVAAAAAVLVAACTSTSPPKPPKPPDRSDQSDRASAPAADGLLPAAWESPLTAVEPPAAAAGGFVFHGLSPARQFEVVSVAAPDGRVRWRAPASPSRVDHGVGLHLATAQDGRTVVWMEPGRSYQDGDVSLVAADAVTGRKRWSYGSGRLRVRSAPSVCRDGAAVCLTAYLAGSDKPRAVVLNVASGRVLSDRATPFVGDVRELTDGLYAAGEQLAVVDDQGELVWYRTAPEVFGGLKVSPDFGWQFDRTGDRYLGSLGRVRPDDAKTTALTDLSATAAFDARTGRTLWTRPRTGVSCGQLAFDVEHPVLCSYTGTANADATKFTDLQVTLTGIDPATGKTRWQAPVGPVEGLVANGDDVIRTGARTYTLRGADGLTALDLQTGPRPAGDAGDTRWPGDTGWCSTDAEVTPARNVLGVNRGDPPTYNVDRRHPCRLTGSGLTALERPTRPADFLDATVDGVFAYTTEDGTLRAVRTT